MCKDNQRNTEIFFIFHSRTSLSSGTEEGLILLITYFGSTLTGYERRVRI